MTDFVVDRVWLFIGVVCLGLLMVQSRAVFTFGHFGLFLIVVGFCLVVREEKKESKK